MSQGFTRSVSIDADTSLSSNSDFVVASQRATKSYVDTAISTLGGGSVTSVSATGTNGITVTGSPINSSGTLSMAIGTISGGAVWNGGVIATTYTAAKATAAIDTIGSGLSLASGTLTATGSSYSAAAPIALSGSTITTSMSTNKLLGRSTALTGVAEEITIGSGLSLSSGTLTSTVSGAVTSVAVSGANGIGVSGSPITSAGTIALSLGTITPSVVSASGSISGLNLSGTNTGDQTSIVGITGTKAQFNTACSDGDFLYTSSLVSNQTEVDFGSTPVSRALFTITDSSITSGMRIIPSVAYEAPTNKGLEEAIMESFDLKCAAASGSFSMYIQTYDGSLVAGKFKVNYLAA